jgi:hypothetical protein
MGKKREGPDPRETIRIVDSLMKRGLSDAQFRSLHHLGDTLAGFRHYCSTVQSFVPQGKNSQLHDRLRKMLDSYQTRDSAE